MPRTQYIEFINKNGNKFYHMPIYNPELTAKFNTYRDLCGSCASTAKMRMAYEVELLAILNDTPQVFTEVAKGTELVGADIVRIQDFSQ